MGVCPTCDRPVGAEASECECGLPRPEAGWPADRMVGEVVAGRYRIERRLGVGGFGIVFVATQLDRGLELGRVALKLLRTDRLHVPGAVTRFVDEARSAREVSSPHAVKVFDAGLTPDGLPFTVMELLEHPSLADVIARDAPLPPRRATRIADQVATAMVESHARGIVHRDLKPANILVGPDDFVKVIDFGIARRVNDRAGSSFTRIGSPAYMAPEQARGDALDGRADVYSLGVLLVEMLTGERPNAGALPPGVAASLRELCASMVAPAADARPQSMAVVRARLRSARGPSLVARVRTETQSAHGGSPGARRRRAPLAWGVGLLLVGAVAFVVFGGVLRSAPEGERPGPEEDPSASAHRPPQVRRGGVGTGDVPPGGAPSALADGGRAPDGGGAADAAPEPPEAGAPPDAEPGRRPPRRRRPTPAGAPGSDSWAPVEF